MAQREQRLPERSQMNVQDQWDLTSLFADEAAWEAEYAQTQAQVEAMAAYEGRLGDSAQALLAGLQAHTQLMLHVERLYVYACLRRDENNALAESQARADRATQLMVAADSATAFITPEILAIPPAELQGYLNSLPALAEYRHVVEEMELLRPHTLSKQEERLLAMSSEMAQAADDIYSMLTDADLRFPSVTLPDGQRQEITHGRYLSLMRHSDREVRRQTFEAYYATYKGLENTLSATLSSSIKKDLFYARARRYDSALEASLAPNRVPVSVYESLIAAVRAALPDLHRYMALRKRVMGVEELHMYDLYTTLVPEADLQVRYEEGKAWVLAGLAPLGSEYIKQVEAAFDARWVDVYENRGKTSGAYSWGVWGAHPYVLMNWQDDVNHVFTLAHEMGHAMHSYLSDKYQSYVNAGNPLLLAEVASTCNEALLMQHLLATREDPKLRLYLLNDYLEQFRTTLFRQTMFAEFELIAHRKAEAGEPLTPEAFCQIYRQLNVDYYGPDVVVDEEIDMEWSRIPHFYRAYYVYQYATGFASAIALSRQVLSGEGGRDRYLRFLSSGNRDFPLTLLQEAGVDLTQPQAVQQALDTFRERVEEMERYFST